MPPYPLRGASVLCAKDIGGGVWHFGVRVTNVVYLNHKTQQTCLKVFPCYICTNDCEDYRPFMNKFLIELNQWLLKST
jgi:hypothetical protein